MRTKRLNRWIAFFAVIMLVFTLLPTSICDVNKVLAQEGSEANKAASSVLEQVREAKQNYEELIPDSVMTIADVKELDEDIVITVIGQVLYKFTENSNSYTIIGDNIAGDILGLQVCAACDNLAIGVIVKITGTVGDYNGVRQISNLQSTDVVLSENEVTSVIQPQVVAIEELKNNIDEYLSEVVKIENVKLGSPINNNIAITDKSGNSLNIYKVSAYPESEKDDLFDVTVVASKYKDDIRLRVGGLDSYRKVGEYEVNSNVLHNVFKFAGNGEAVATSPIYADLVKANNYLDKNTSLELSTGVIPQITNKDNDVSNIGSTGLSKDAYYLIKTSSGRLANLELTFQMKGSQTGAKDFKISYSTDENEYISEKVKVNTYYKAQYNPAEVNVDTDDGTFSLTTSGGYHDIRVKLPAKASNAEKLYIKIEVASSTNINNGTIGDDGNNYLANINCVANPIISDEFCGVVELKSEDNTVGLGDLIELSTDTKDATIYYAQYSYGDFNKLDESDFEEYKPEETPTYNELPIIIAAYAKKDGISNSIISIYVVRRAKVAEVKATPDGGKVKLNSTVKLSTATEGATIRYTLDNTYWYDYENGIILESLPATITAYAAKDDYEDSDSVTFQFTERTNTDYNIYFGQIHSHTNISDGSGTLAEAYDYAKKVDGLSFLAVTDHSNYFDHDTLANIHDGSESSEWVDAKKLAKKVTEEVKINVDNNPGTTKEFVTLYGYEMTWSDGVHGHINTYNTEGFLSRNITEYKSSGEDSLTNYYAALKTAPDSISMFNHPGKNYGDFEGFDHYDEEIDQLITLIEVGNGEGPVRGAGYFPSYSYYTEALDRGWHVAPTNNQDNHKGKWGDANTARTVILADELTEESIYDAMRSMRVYATEDEDFRLIYKLNDADMGTVFEKKQDEVNINVKMEDPTDSGNAKVKVIVNGGKEAASCNISGNNANIDFKPDPVYDYYYIRIEQADGDIIVSAPVWIDKVDAVGFSNFSIDTELPIKGEELEITAKMYNNEKVPFTINSLKFMIGNEVIHTVNLSDENLTSLEASKTTAYKFNYTCQKVGSVEIKAVLEGEESKTYAGSMSITFADPGKVATILVDGTHNNDYVTGYYGGSLMEFTKLAAQRNVKLHVEENEITEEMLDACSLLIITPPSKKSGSYDGKAYGVSHFEVEFIKLIQDYVAKGKDIVVCGITDYQDTQDSQTSTETNKLLEAIGATTRINPDEAQDEVNSGEQNYSLYLSNINYASTYTQGIIHGNTDEKANQNYYVYAGCTLALDETAYNDGKITWLVQGSDTTKSVPTKSYAASPGGEAATLDGIESVVFLAHEKLDEVSNLLISGTVFMADQDIKVFDNASDLPHANQNIVTNLIKLYEISSNSTPGGSGNDSNDSPFVVGPGNPGGESGAPETETPEAGTPGNETTEEDRPDNQQEDKSQEDKSQEDTTLDVTKTVNAEKNAEIKDSITELLQNDDELDAIAAITKADTEDYSSAALSINVKKLNDVAVGDTVYVYKYNPKTEKYEELVNGTCTVEKRKKINLKVADEGLYVVTNKKLKSDVVKSIKTQIAEKITIKGKNKATIRLSDNAKCKIKVTLPKSISSVVNKESIKITYKSLNKKIARVTANGNVMAKATGTVKIKVTVKFDGKVISTKTLKITVKK